MRRFVVLSVAVAWAVLVTSTAPALAQDPVLRPPVSAEILDPFRLPNGPYGAGNRGIEYATDAGDRIGAAGSGTVVWAGPVAGVVYVSIEHEGGLRTSYGPLQQLRVTTGDVVDRGAQLGSATGAVHFSTRIDGEYVDPASLFGVRRIDVRLVPHRADDTGAFLAAVELGERHALYDLVQERRGGARGGVAGAIGEIVAIMREAVDPSSLVAGLAAHAEILVAIAPELEPAEMVRRMILGLVEVADPPPCTTAETAARVPTPVGRRIAVVIDGLDSSTANAGIRAELDLASVGYRADDVVRFSYDGGLAPEGGHNWDADMPRSTYRPESTHGGIEGHIDRFAEVLLRVRAANPGVAIDVYGHSLGGVVARHAIARVDDDVGVSVAVTLASPHDGAPAATVLDAARHHQVGAGMGEMIESLDPDHVIAAPILSDLSEVGFAGDTADVAFPEAVHAVTIGARADVVVPASAAGAAGADHHVVVGGFDPVGAHGAIAALPEVHREVRLALAGLDPACTGIRDRILDLVVPDAIATAERAAAAGIVASEWLG
ncbi:MAG: peptidoglycan DD-metalloendopeptidase family protein [Actinomycetota bacterium]